MWNFIIFFLKTLSIPTDTGLWRKWDQVVKEWKSFDGVQKDLWSKKWSCTQNSIRSCVMIKQEKRDDRCARLAWQVVCSKWSTLSNNNIRMPFQNKLWIPSIFWEDKVVIGFPVPILPVSIPILNSNFQFKLSNSCFSFWHSFYN